MEQEIKLNTPYITLGQLLKIANIISSGGQAKIFLQEYADEIFINGEADNRRGRKLYPSDKIKISDFGTYIMKA
ncbi:S4 domain-containing protein YaaA [Ligilactobacillus sp. WILCCON 0076]|uniref:S4 domain-containing protein YaaA n=1 Tax=Ligilactobacillus ubinensis TaxID=2876789 RepID=A0A9X2FJZ1_9LACO|nr:S4 domain-containing protein YaaA [Ligilactobacillus ubinensis]MCP0887077.1 S4 domain-containing protein YaaA [Ligilactobacillus ubinensis]